MTGDTSARNLDGILAAWLAEGPAELPVAARSAIATAVSTSRQRRVNPFVSGFRVPVPIRVWAIVLVGLIAISAVLGGVLGGGSTAPPSPRQTIEPSAGTPSSPSSSLFAPLGYSGPGTIAFTTPDATGQDDLWLIDPDGTNARLFQAGGCCGLFSPDGTELAMGVPGVSPPGTNRDPSLLGIKVVGAPDGATSFTVPTGCAACAILNFNYEPDAWSPDGRYIALAFWLDGSPGQDGMGIADRDFPPFAWDWAQLRATGNHSDIPVAFSPDSSLLLFMRQEQRVGPTSIGPLFLLRIADSNVRQITPPGVSVQTNGIIQAPASWSPDGRTIVFAGTNAETGSTSIFATSPAADASIRTLVPDARGATSARFSPDGTRVVFDRLAGATGHDLFLVAPDGSNETDLTADFAPGVCCGQWSPDGGALLISATSSADFNTNLAIVSADGKGIWQLTTTPGPHTAFVWGAGFR